jgi:hypothetical protein
MAGILRGAGFFIGAKKKAEQRITWNPDGVQIASPMKDPS